MSMQKKNAPRKAADPDKIHAEYGKDGVFVCYDYPTWENIFLSSGVGIRMSAAQDKPRKRRSPVILPLSKHGARMTVFFEGQFVKIEGSAH